MNSERQEEMIKVGVSKSKDSDDGGRRERERVRHREKMCLSVLDICLWALCLLQFVTQV